MDYDQTEIPRSYDAARGYDPATLAIQRMFRQRPYRAFLTSDVGLGGIQVLLLANMMHLS